MGPELLSDVTRRRVREYVGAFLEREAARFVARVAAGRSRDCHGDLQAQHVCCVEPVQIFDCIEFNHRFRFGDVAGEIAFLAMDLERLGRPDLAIRFLNAYLEENGDYEAVPLLDFYRAYRAWVRAKVTAFQVADHPERAGEAQTLFELAGRFVAPHRRPRLVITTGVMGTGKSTAARHAAARLGAIVVRTDAVRKRLGGVPLRERVATTFGEGLYTPEMGRRTYVEAARLADELLRAGWPVIVDGSFSHAAERARGPRGGRPPWPSVHCALVRRPRRSARGTAPESERGPARGLRWPGGATGRAPRPLRVAGSRAGGGRPRHGR